MSKGLRFRGEVMVSFALVLAFGLTFALVGCGGDRQETSEGRAVGEVGPTSVAELPPPEVTTRLAAIEPEEVETTTVVEVPEPPREVTYEEAEGVFFEKRYGEAAELFARYIERRPENPWGQYMLGLSAWKAGEYERAEVAFESALALDPLHVKSWLNLSRVMLDTDRAEEALEAIEEALVIDSEHGVAYRLQGRAYHQLGQLEDAIDAYHRAILVDAGDAWSMNNLGLILIEEARFEEALGPLARAVELRDDIAFFQNNLGVALERTGHFRTAEEAYKSALALDGTHEKAQVNFSRVEALEEATDQPPVDLGALAEGFVSEVQGWREAVAHRDLPEAIPDEVSEEIMLEPIVVSEADTTKVDPPEKEQ